jgi:UDP-GlcNAc:undecaprenyl-phosphate/decaprenyl-phosphate GlcNAc-1-phosphate transferase
MEMKPKMIMKWLAVMGCILIASHAMAEDVVSLKTSKDKVNYSIGVSTMRNFKQYGTGSDIDLDMVIRGMRDELNGKTLLLSEKDLRSVLTAVQTEIMQKKRTARALATMPSASVRAGTEHPGNKEK